MITLKRSMWLCFMFYVADALITLFNHVGPHHDKTATARPCARRHWCTE